MKTEITTDSIKWQELDGSNVLKCPICGQVWEQEGVDDILPCEHLRCRHIDGIDTEFFGRWDQSNFDIDDAIDGKIDDINAIYTFEEMGMSCGPVFIHVLYGVKK